ncbi:PREDICTED: RNA pseudouridylate synthase domain-containing protein 2-like [Amphimedon queenslandica]|uniref:Pseudouridine synthase n=1 Tax=Amphimedon queenslandica TaxID=400682 RepID=A0A1X7U9W7_AMPQE|nr:PREDICTED: RNA pseudouridylate synthase domain-containing protein 2-like [Amphimedon queenslandica]|eukprot:XP_019855401.1 PREDICTED: RNA pseudouridylate synthase domain-containing protein 2-like [Amphimedon queenslandica]
MASVTKPIKRKASPDERQEDDGVQFIPKRMELQPLKNESIYYFRNGLRHVIPYYFKFSTHAKGRWVGRKVYDVFSEEFQSEKPEYYERAINLGKVTVNGKVATMETVIKDNDVVTHLVHRHEPPVSSQSINIITNNKELLVVNKPPSIPVHPCGRYRQNTMINILKNEYDIDNIYTIHRLDKCTSGLLLFGKRISKVQEIEEQIRDRQVHKEYLALVNGHFNHPGTIECNESIKVLSHKVGVCMVDPVNGKDCSTSFTLLHYDKTNNRSLVKCEPKTGRMHQIRVHLQYLGFPIINDPLYSHSCWTKHNQTENILSDIIASRFPQQPIINETTDTIKTEEIEKKEESEAKGTNNSGLVLKEKKYEEDKEIIFNVDPHCTECHAPSRPDPTHNELIMYLHALSYTGPNWGYRTDPPEWAREYLKDL